MDIQFELILSGKLVFAAIFGAIIGYEREAAHKDAGMRTFSIICLASCLFVAVASHLTDDKSAIARMLAAIPAGLGFISAGLAFKDKSQSMQGLTTSTALWSASAIGAALALNMFLLSFLATVLTLLVLSLNKFRWYQKLFKTKEKSSDKI
jgi:putative Mg2+ transporter-C (MgtC) family protein